MELFWLFARNTALCVWTLPWRTFQLLRSSTSQKMQLLCLLAQLSKLLAIPGPLDKHCLTFLETIYVAESKCLQLFPEQLRDLEMEKGVACVQVIQDAFFFTSLKLHLSNWGGGRGVAIMKLLTLWVSLLQLVPIQQDSMLPDHVPVQRTLVIVTLVRKERWAS